VPEARKLRLGFLTEHTAGHVTFQAGLRLAAAEDPEIEAVWHPLPFPPRGLLERLPPLSANWSARSSLRARAVLARSPGAYDALLFHTQTASLLSAGVMNRVPTVMSSDATPRNIDQVGEGYRHRTAPPPIEDVKLRIVRRPLRAARTHVLWSEWARRSLIADYGVPIERTHVVRPGIDTASWPRWRGSGDPAMRLLFVGADFERKGGDLLLEALATVREPWSLDLVTRSAVPSRPDVRVHHSLSPNDGRLKALFAEADVFVLPTRADALPLVVVEAMAAGLPVIASRVAAIPEAVEHERTGLLVDPGSVSSLHRALERLRRDRDERRAMGERGREVAVRRFDARANGSRIISLMKQLAVEGPQPADPAAGD
jgi:glycosyltransferase involved in cell wall biosynthesis